MNPKIIIGVIVIVLIAGGLYFIVDKKSEKPNQQTSTDDINSTTANWKTYKNDQYGFEIKYPNDYEITKLVIGGAEVDESGELRGEIKTQIGLRNTDNDNRKDYPFIIISLPGDKSMGSLNPNAKTLTDYQKDYTSYLSSRSGWKVAIEVNEHKIINGIESLK